MRGAHDGRPAAVEARHAAALEDPHAALERDPAQAAGEQGGLHDRAVRLEHAGRVDG